MEVGDIYFDRIRLVTVFSVGDYIEYKDSIEKMRKLKCKTFLKRFSPVNMNLHKQKKIKVTDFDSCSVHSDAGGHGLKFHCPVCGDEIIWAEMGWWGTTCMCREWRVEIQAIGKKC